MIQQEGPGWRVARDPERENFCILVGGDGWAFELTEDEGHGLAGLVTALEQQHSALADQLMAEEDIELELERGVWWGCLAGDRQQWSLSVVLTPSRGRGAEGHWPHPASAAVVAAMRTLWDGGTDQLS